MSAVQWWFRRCKWRTFKYETLIMFATSIPSHQRALPYGQFRFHELATIGQGGLGRVHRIRIIASNAPNMPTGSDWAAKSLNQKWAHHPVIRERFEREIAALKRMAHRNIVTYQGENLPGGQRFYVMPLFSTSLRAHIAAAGHQGDWRAIAELGASLADALQYAHALGFIHRDLKPDNILFNDGGPLVIADWGLGYFVHRESQVLQQLTVGGMGTEYYCSLEQWTTGKCDCRGDIYSLGMTIDEWVTGQQRAIIVGDGVSGLTTHQSNVGAQQFNALIQEMTQKYRRNRPASMHRVAAVLRGASRA